MLLLTCPSLLQVWSIHLFTEVISTLGNITEDYKLSVCFFIISFHLPIELLRLRTHTICSQPFWLCVLQCKWQAVVLLSVSRQVHCLFRIELSTECDLVLRL